MSENRSGSGEQLPDRGEGERVESSLDALLHDVDLADIFTDQAAAGGHRVTEAGGAMERGLSRTAPASRRPQPAVTIAPDGLAAFLTLPEVPGGYREEEILSALAEAGVVHGIDTPAVGLLAAMGKCGRLLPIAEGSPSKPGRDAFIEHLFELPSRTLSEHGGRVDWREVTLVHSVSAGQALARKHPGQPGEPGMTVQGKPIVPKLPRDVRVAFGPGVSLAQDDPNLTVATVSGAVRLDVDGKLTVDNTYVVKGDVDLATGNVEFSGSVVIHGDVKRGFSIKATGDIEVNGAVEDANVFAGGAFLVKGGILGSAGIASVQAGGDILARFANNARLLARRDVILAQEAINCHIEAEGSVIVGGKLPTKGAIRGGTTRAAREVSTHGLGSVAGIATRVEVGYGWLLPGKLQSLDGELAQRQAQWEKTRARMQELTEERAVADLPTAKRLLLEKLRLADQALRVTVRSLEDQRERWSKMAAYQGCIIVHGTIHPGVELVVDGKSRTITEPRSQERFVVQGNSIIGLSLKN
ncbi:MAG: DUF342 domain-containing protein [Chloroflexota bacterium]